MEKRKTKKSQLIVQCKGGDHKGLHLFADTLDGTPALNPLSINICPAEAATGSW